MDEPTSGHTDQSAGRLPTARPLERGVKLAAFLAERREAHRLAVEALQSALREGTDQEVVLAAQRVRELGVATSDVRWEAVYQVEERHAALQAYRAALATGGEEVVVDAWSKVRGRWEQYLTPEEQATGSRAFQQWGRSLRRWERRELEQTPELEQEA